jgi:hypothetical protein
MVVSRYITDFLSKNVINIAIERAVRTFLPRPAFWGEFLSVFEESDHSSTITHLNLGWQVVAYHSQLITGYCITFNITFKEWFSVRSDSHLISLMGAVYCSSDIFKRTAWLQFPRTQHKSFNIVHKCIESNVVPHSSWFSIFKIQYRVLSRVS